MKATALSIWRTTGSSGFAALFSVVLIGALLLIVAISLSTFSFSARMNVLEFEIKKTSLALAEACVHQAMFDVSSGSFKAKSVAVGASSCKICSVQAFGNQYSVLTRAVAEFGAEKSFSTVQAVISKDAYGNVAVLSWFEIAANPEASCTVP